MRRRILESGNSGGVNPSQSKACDICFYDKTADNLVIVDGDTWNIETYPVNRYTPIGIVVVPGYHDVYGDGSCGVMSLREMNYNTPDKGSTSRQNMCWGQYDSNISQLTDYNVVCHIGNNGNPQSTIQGTINNAYLPSDRYSNIQCPHDTDAYYRYNDRDYYIPSPYLTNGERNPLYYQTTSPSSANNAMSDFDGESNSWVLWDRAIAQSDWKTASTIIDSPSSGYSPAACCCWRYYTEGTSQGDWYLPACGELGYTISPFNKINKAIRDMQTTYDPSVGIELDTSFGYWSSTKYSSNAARNVYTTDSHVSYYGKNGGLYVRAFLRVK